LTSNYASNQAIPQQQNTKIKQSQAKSERGFVLRLRMKSSNTIAKNTQKSSKVKPSLSEVLPFAYVKSQSKSTVK
jgi:hypothetical protein